MLYKCKECGATDREEDLDREGVRGSYICNNCAESSMVLIKREKKPTDSDYLYLEEIDVNNYIGEVVEMRNDITWHTRTLKSYNKNKPNCQYFVDDKGGVWAECRVRKIRLNRYEKALKLLGIVVPSGYEFDGVRVAKKGELVLHLDREGDYIEEYTYSRKNRRDIILRKKVLREESYRVPIDADARYRPMVEFTSPNGDKINDQLLQVVTLESGTTYFISVRGYKYTECRMLPSELSKAKKRMRKDLGM